jgi:hypothetical protein
MQRPRRYRIVSIVLCLALGGLGVVTACSNYGEGERCEIANNNDDCQSPLQCTPAAQLNAPFKGADRCCPVDRTTATHPACTVLQSSIGGDSAPPPETGPGTDATTTDAPVETSTPADTGTADAADAAEGG